MAQSLARLWTHLIFSTKERYPFLFDPSVRADMHAYLGTFCARMTVPRSLWEARQIMCTLCSRFPETIQLLTSSRK
jgi:hypothetical protein